jgi:hypothetical protein
MQRLIQLKKEIKDAKKTKSGRVDEGTRVCNTCLRSLQEKYEGKKHYAHVHHVTCPKNTKKYIPSNLIISMAVVDGDGNGNGNGNDDNAVSNIESDTNATTRTGDETWAELYPHIATRSEEEEQIMLLEEQERQIELSRKVNEIKQERKNNPTQQDLERAQKNRESSKRHRDNLSEDEKCIRRMKDRNSKRMKKEKMKTNMI